MSRVALLSVYTPDYKPLADLTFNKNKALYCAKYGYTGYNIECALHKQGFTKFKAALNILDHHEWVWITGTDSMVTNFQKDVYEVLDLQNPAISFVGAYDANSFNADSVLIRNDVYGHTLLQAVESLYNTYDNEQHSTIVLLEQNQFWRDRAKFTYQWEMNSYLYGLYTGYTPVDCVYGVRGEWQEGDLLIHWPGVSYGRRMLLAQEYIDGKVIY